MIPAGRTKGKGYYKENHFYVSFFYISPLICLTRVSYVNSKRRRKEGCSNEGKRGKAERKKRRGQLETVKMGEERGQRMEGRERGISCEFLV